MYDKTKAYFKFGKKETDLKDENIKQNYEQKPIISNTNLNHQSLNVSNRNQRSDGFDNAVNLDNEINNPYPNLDNNRNDNNEVNLDR